MGSAAGSLGFGGLSNGEAIFGVATGGMFAGTAEANKARRDAEQAAAEAKASEAARQAKIDQNIKRIRTLYGVADDTPGADNTEANANKSKLDAWLNDYGSTVESANDQSVQDQFGTAELESRRNLARQGLLGGSVDVQNQRNQLSQYIAGRQKALAAGRAAKTSAGQSLLTHRLQLEGQAATGTQLNPDFSAFTQQLQSGLDTARSNIAPSAVGNLFTVAGQTAGTAIANGGGRSDPTTIDASAGRTTGDIT